MSVVPSSLPLKTFSGEARIDDGDAIRNVLDKSLTAPADRFLSQSGKRIRAAIVNEAYRAAGGRGDAPESIAEGIELLHAGSLIVDDIEDDSAVRRGRSTLHREVGMPLALNIGNWMYFRALEKLGESALSSSATHAILTRSIRTIRRCHEGQALDLGGLVYEMPIADLFPTARQISRLKTGGLTGFSAWLGATVAKANAPTRKAFSRFGMAVGICLQMRNDLQELHHFVLGNDRFDDLRNARVTWAWAWASRIASPSDMKSLQSQLQQAPGQRDEYRSIARRLIQIVGDRADVFIDSRLQRELRMLGEHVDSTQGLRSALSRLRK